MSLAECFLACLPPQQRRAFATGHDLAALLDAAVGEGRGAWPGLRLSPEAFARFLAGAVAAAPGPPLEGRRFADLYLAAACAEGEKKGLTIVESTFFPKIAAAMRREGHGDVAIDEALQALREKLFVRTPSRPPGIVSYAGRGGLRAFLAVTAFRELSTGRRPFAREVALEDAMLESLPASGDPELSFLKRRYGGALREALADAVARLDPRDRDPLRQQLVERLSVEQIAALSGLHPVSAARRISRARVALVRQLRKSLRGRLGLTPSELQSLLKPLESQLSVGLDGALEKKVLVAPRAPRLRAGPVSPETPKVIIMQFRRTFFAALVALMAYCLACGSSGDDEQGAGPGAAGGPSGGPSDCARRCQAAFTRCRAPGGACDMLCSRVTEAQLACVERSDCASAQQCLEAGQGQGGSGQGQGGSGQGQGGSGQGQGGSGQGGGCDPFAASPITYTIKLADGHDWGKLLVSVTAFGYLPDGREGPKHGQFLSASQPSYSFRETMCAPRFNLKVEYANTADAPPTRCVAGPGDVEETTAVVQPPQSTDRPACVAPPLP